MTPPEADVAGKCARATEPSAAFRCLNVLRHRAEFLRAARARRQGTAGFMLQARQREPDESGEGIRVGFTASKKIGNAVARNRAKRRLREVARAVLHSDGKPGWDYVLVARPGATISRDYALLLNDLRRALASVHTARDVRAQRP